MGAGSTLRSPSIDIPRDRVTGATSSFSTAAISASPSKSNRSSRRATCICTAASATPSSFGSGTCELWRAAHQSFALRRWVSEHKFGPHRVVCRTPLTNIRITTFFAGEHEMRIVDPFRVEVLAAIGCEVRVVG